MPLPFGLLTLKRTLEAVQRQSARFICNNYSPYASVSEMLNKFDFKTFTERRNESKLIKFSII